MLVSHDIPPESPYSPIPAMKTKKNMTHKVYKSFKSTMLLVIHELEKEPRRIYKASTARSTSFGRENGCLGSHSWLGYHFSNHLIHKLYVVCLRNNGFLQDLSMLRIEYNGRFKQCGHQNYSDKQRLNMCFSAISRSSCQGPLERIGTCLYFSTLQLYNTL
jgi:hypothetical protein